MIKAVFMSIKQKPMENIIKKKKTYEFRNYIPKKEFNTIFVYESLPVGELKYIIKIGEVIERSNKIEKDGIGNKDFNLGNMGKYAYEIKNVFMLDYPISLKTLKEKYNFNPPQRYIYASSNFRLSNYILNSKMTQIL